MNKIQRKFLISADMMRWLKQQKYTLQKSEQFYVKSEDDRECYYLKYFPDTYAKVKIDAEGKEVLSSVEEEMYCLARKQRMGRKIVKKTYTVVQDEVTFEISKYLKGLKGLSLLTVTFKDERARRDAEVMDALQVFILKEIDEDIKYKDRSLALYVKPMEYDIHKFFDKIDAFESANLFFWQVPRRLYLRDGIALVLYRNLRLIHHYKVNFQRKHMSATLHRLRVLLRRTASILETFPELFTPGVQRFGKDLLIRYYDETKLLRYLYFLEELCGSKDNASLALRSELKTLTFEEEKAVTQMLFDKPFSQLIQILTRELYDQENYPYLDLTKEVKKVVKTKLETFEALLVQTKEGLDDAMRNKLYYAMDILQILIEDFYHIIGEKETRMLVEELNILFKPLREYRNCKDRVLILEEIKTQAENKTLNTDPLLCEHKEEIAEKIDHALKLLRSSTFYV